jgi:hypothetical protein
MKRVRVVIVKEWREAFKGGKTVWIGTVAIPFILLGISLFQLFQISDFRNIPPEKLPEVVGALFLIPLLYFLMFPLVIPHSIAIYAVMSEKEQKSLEPLLATPLRTGELFLAKMFASVLPAVGITWVAFGLFLVVVQALLPQKRLRACLGAVRLHLAGDAGALCPAGRNVHDAGFDGHRDAGERPARRSALQQLRDAAHLDVGILADLPASGEQARALGRALRSVARAGHRAVEAEHQALRARRDFDALALT